MKKEFLKSMPKLNHDAKIGFVLNDFTNLIGLRTKFTD